MKKLTLTQKNRRHNMKKFVFYTNDGFTQDISVVEIKETNLLK